MDFDATPFKGKTYEYNGQQFECVTVYLNQYLIVLGKTFDSTNNRTSFTTHKLVEVKFVGKVS